ncbi:hypothetical protein GLYMA_04G201000v4 [Glycine max]|nr:hypothetical protein GLYMA_04G201000v4 [Glycine max]KAH1112298.1 hypothetical protein GYH30_010538 [Glycine max]
MESVDANSEVENDAEMKLLRDKFRLSAISIIESQERLARDLHLFAQHANRKSVNMEDVILCGHRNEHVSGMLRSFSNDLKAKDPQSERKRKKEPKKNDKGTA